MLVGFSPSHRLDSARTRRGEPLKDEAFLTTEEVLESLQVNLRTVYRLIKAGKIPVVRIGRQWRFRKSDIAEWLARQTAVDSPASERSVGGSTPPPRATGRQRVLVVDDETSIRDLLSEALTLANYDAILRPTIKGLSNS